MTNKELAKIFLEISGYLEMQDVPFKPRAYEKVAEAIDGLEKDVVAIYKEGGLKALEDIPGVGKSIAEKIEEFIRTGKIAYHSELKEETPVELSELMAVEGLGPKKIKALYEELGIKNIKMLEQAAKAGKIRKLEHFGEKTEENIKKRLSFIEKTGGRFIFGEIEPFIEDIKEKIGALPYVDKIEIAGSFRRRKDTIGDADILVSSKEPEKVMEYFTNMPGIIDVTGKGDTKSSIKMSNGLNIDLRAIEPASYGAALVYFTGSKDHNVAIREIAIKKGMKLNEYGLFKGKKIMAGKTEESIYKVLGLDYVEPELRENKGEIELARKRNLPRLLKQEDIKGDLQVQTNWTDGASSIKEMAEEAIRLGREYILITDHTKRLTVANGLDEKRLLEQMKEIDKLNAEFKKKNIKFTILKGTECDILKDGSLDIKDEVLEKLDIVGASIHSHFNLSIDDQTKRLKKAMSNKNVDIIFHPTGRVINKREAYQLNVSEIISFAKETGTVLEIDAYPERADLNDEYIREAVSSGVKLCIDSDAHAISHLGFIKYGVFQARRGYAKKSDIINTLSVDKLLKALK